MNVKEFLELLENKIPKVNGMKKWNKIKDDELISIILNTHKNNIPGCSNCLKVLIIRLINDTDKSTLQLINSPDSDTRELGIQLLFKDHLDIYNLLNESIYNYQWELHIFPSLAEVYLNDKEYVFIYEECKLMTYFKNIAQRFCWKKQ